MRLFLAASATNERGPQYVEAMLQSLPLRSRRRSSWTLELANREGLVGLAVEAAPELSVLLQQRLQDAYPGLSAEFRQTDAIANTAREESAGQTTWCVELWLTPDVWPLATYREFEESLERELADPLGPILSAIRTGRGGKIDVRVQLEIQPASEHRIRQAQRVLATLSREFPLDWVRSCFERCCSGGRVPQRLLARLLSWLSRSGEQDVADVEQKLGQHLFECRLRILVTAPVDAGELARARLQQVAGAFGQFTSRRVWFEVGPVRRRIRNRGGGFLLTAAEIATLWHPLVANVAVARLERSEFKEAEPPGNLPSHQRTSLRGPASNSCSGLFAERTGFAGFPSKEGTGEVTVLGRVKFRRERQQFGIRADDLRRHLLVVGKTGCGKSTFLQNIVLQQIEAGRGVVLIDPHGQLVEEVLDFIPKRRTNDVILFDAGDREFCVPFNPLVGPPESDPTLVADGVLTAFKKVFGFDESSAPRLLHIFRNCLLSLIGRPDASLSAVQRLLTDANYRKSVTAQVTNPAVREFWLSEFGRWNDRDRTQYIASLQNKLGAFTTNQRLQRIFASAQRGLNLRAAMDDSQILLCNLSKGLIGHEASTLLGSLLISSLQTAAMSRADIPEEDRADCTVVIDEFHSYLSEGNSTMADALAELRKYRTSYVLSTQLLEQMDRSTLAGVLGNCGSTLCMTVGPRDAEVLAELLGSGLSSEDLMNIPKYHGYIRLLIDGTAKTFSMTTLPPPRDAARRAEIIRNASRQRFGIKAHKIHGKTLAGTGGSVV